MFVLDRIRTCRDWNIRIPLYHRGHLSLYPGTTVYLAPVLRLGNSPRGLPEILGTTIHSNSWTTLYLVSIGMRDAPGVLYTVLRSIANHGGNVLNLDSTSTDQEAFHQIELVVDFASLSRTEGERLDLSSEIRGILLVDCCDHLLDEEKTGFGIRVQPHRGLRRLNSTLGRVRTPRNEPIVQEAQIGPKGHIEIERPLRHLVGLDSEYPRLAPPFGYFINSDTDERTFRVTIVPNEGQVIWCAVRHNDRPGALAAITGQIQSGGVTVLAALNRLQRHQGRSWFEAVLSKDGWTGPGSPTELTSRHEEIYDLVAQVDVNQTTKGEFSPTLFFDRSEADAALRAPATEASDSGIILLRPKVHFESWLSEKEQYLRRLSEPPAETDSQELSIKRSALSSGIRLVRYARNKVSPRLFLSIEFTEVNDERIDIARAWCVGRGIDLDVVKRAKDQPVVRDEVLSRIHSATHFIGVWTPSAKSLDGDRCSPWMLWELGVASARAIPARILIQEGLKHQDYKAIYPEVYYFSFSANKSGSFRREFEQACLQVFRSPPEVH